MHAIAAGVLGGVQRFIGAPHQLARVAEIG
jgi:hypothetical protein